MVWWINTRFWWINTNGLDTYSLNTYGLNTYGLDTYGLDTYGLDRMHAFNPALLLGRGASSVSKPWVSKPQKAEP